MTDIKIKTNWFRSYRMFLERNREMLKFLLRYMKYIIMSTVESQQF